VKHFLTIRLLVFGIFVAAGLVACEFLTLNNQKDDELTCLLPPESFQEEDLIGIWIASYFGDVDKLIIHSNGTYKQIFSSDTINFESKWQKWWVEYNPKGYALLHLEGMRRCDDFNKICNIPGGGLPPGEEAIDPCTSERITYNDEVILFVTGYPDDVPRGIVLRHARLVGSDWTHGFKLDGAIGP
jgi:hypothetical protein